MEGIKNFLILLNQNWTTILIIVGLIAGMWQKGLDYFSKPRQKQIQIVKSQIQQIILMLVTEAEEGYEETKKAGQIKRSQVIYQIYEKFPILNRIMNQEEFLDWLDAEIDNALDTLKQINLKNESKG